MVGVNWGCHFWVSFCCFVSLCCHAWVCLHLQRAWKSLTAVEFPTRVRTALELLGPWCDICHQVEADR